MSAPRLCVTGSINMDLVVSTRRFPAPGETVMGHRYEAFPGGKGANQTVAAARLGAETCLLGCIGDDPYGRELLAHLRAQGLEVDGVITRPGVPTGVALITVREDGENTIVVAPGANASLSPADLEGRCRGGPPTDMLVMQLEVPIETVTHAARLAREQGSAVLLNTAPAMHLPEALLEATDILIANLSEAQRLAGRSDELNFENLAEILLSLGPRHVVITLGAEGALLFEEGSSLVQEAFHVEAVDATAAGDAFVAAFAVFWCEGLGSQETLARASAAGALACTRAGAQTSLPDRAELEAFLAARRGS